MVSWVGLCRVWLCGYFIPDVVVLGVGMMRESSWNLVFVEGCF